MNHGSKPLLSRRTFLGAAAAGAGLGMTQWTPAFTITPAEAADASPPDFPGSMEVYQQAWSNWSGEIRVSSVWTCSPRTPQDVVTLANWAHAQGWRLRARGAGHGWSPLLEASGAAADVLMVDTTRHLTAVSVAGGSPACVTAQCGATMLSLLTAAEEAGYGLTNVPAAGDVTLGGVLAIGGHGSSVPAEGEELLAGHTYGSVSNLVVSLTAVVWDSAEGAYVLKTFERDDPDIGAFLVNLGRAFLTEATLRVGPNTRLRCRSSFTTSADALFAPPASAGDNSFAALVKRSGRVETIWFPFTAAPWLKVWTVKPTKPLLSRQVDSPFNYTFCDWVSPETSDFASDIVRGNVAVTPAFENLQFGNCSLGSITTATWDIWGWAKNTQLYVRPTTLRVTANGYAILCARGDVQRVVSEFYDYLRTVLADYEKAGQYPMNGPWEVRVTGLDDPADCGVAGAVSPLLSAVRTRPDQPSWDTAVWMDVLSLPGTPQSQRFFREVEQWVLSNYTGDYAGVRAEWSKGWGYSGTAAWSDPTMLADTVPASYREGQEVGGTWDTAREILGRYDPARIYSSPLLDALMP
ncbi:FAD-binding protein [Streptomyces ipomoeae]|uniref:Cholesterol oxidase n=2 Tax=Streptomyces ipomoeae TaxID=103232 RepID=L1KIC4_9ACTN|nr:cholesterol oxidase substrate-binding domain-containing protein [Streptomyces ipomoeae]EKX60240.1 cholesterol oxidase [Streptomyces ipomoeae 91-03]MDX2700035.1 cholesterol oxidase substrate-binding domain-containing protein [Streptomyces ipomoeae]MDX2825796.1 cholesterol oxidase substrate-binding domain-containing protein [Streptomyces ipomoeae]MDX2841154.1 cholesterol oxidase substrate-binding domain-containing protein [Streptomyces ipomoeae]MDX2877436.1 cholesterol oxidase substrate-bindi